MCLLACLHVGMGGCVLTGVHVCGCVCVCASSSLFVSGCIDCFIDYRGLCSQSPVRLSPTRQRSVAHLASLAHGPHEEGVLQGDVQTATGDAQVWREGDRQRTHHQHTVVDGLNLWTLGTCDSMTHYTAMSLWMRWVHGISHHKPPPPTQRWLLLVNRSFLVDHSAPFLYLLPIDPFCPKQQITCIYLSVKGSMEKLSIFF